MNQHKSIEKFTKATSDILLLNKQFRTYSRTGKFDKAIQKRSIDSPSPKTQLFYGEGRAIWDSVLRETDRLAPGEKRTVDKMSFMNDVISILPDLASVEDFKIIDLKKKLSAIKTEEADFEVSNVAHREPVAEYTGVPVTVGKIKPHVEELSDSLLQRGYEIVQIKNNLITIQTEDNSQFSVKLTKKKNRIFK